MSEEQQAPPLKPRGRPRVTVAPRTPESAFSVEELANDALRRRLQGDPRYVRQAPIPIRDNERWKLKEANSYGDPNAHYEMVHAKGWIPVGVEDLPDGVTAQSIGYRVSEDGHTLCRGERGEERLYKMPMQNYRQLEEAKTRLNKKGTGSAAAVREDIANAAAGMHGSEAGDFVHKHLQIRGEDREGPL